MSRLLVRRIGPALLLALAAPGALAQLTDVTQTPNIGGAGIQKSLVQEVGPGRGDWYLPDSSSFLIARDPFRSIARGRQLFQRKFTAAQGLGPRLHDGVGDIEASPTIGAGLADSCAACHGRPFGSAGFGGNVFTRPESRDAPHLFGLGLKEMLADEITRDLRAIRDAAVAQAQLAGVPVSLPLVSKGVGYGLIKGLPDGSVDTSRVDGVDPYLRVRPFFAHGATLSIREFIVGALKAEMGLEAFDPDLAAASQGQDVVTPAGMVLSGSIDAVEAPPVTAANQDGDQDGVVDEVPQSAVDHLEFYLLNYFKPGLDLQTPQEEGGFALFREIGCARCHVPDLLIDQDRRVADVATQHDPLGSNGVYSQLFATAAPLFTLQDDGSGHPPVQAPALQPFLVERIFTDFKRHDLGPGFHERQFDGTLITEFLTTPLWGVGSTPPYGHDGRSMTLEDVILRHGGEAQAVRDRFASLSGPERAAVVAFLRSLVLFSPPDTPSNLNPADPGHPFFPREGHGSIDLSVLFGDPSDRE